MCLRELHFVGTDITLEYFPNNQINAHLIISDGKKEIEIIGKNKIEELCNLFNNLSDFIF